MPGSTERLIETSHGLVVLASPDLKRFMFPELLDVPVARLVSDEQMVRCLPVPVRSTSAEWNSWLRRKYRKPRMACFSLAFLGGTGAWCSAWAGFPLWLLLASLFLLGVLVFVFLAFLGGYWRDRILWREGEEVHAVLLSSKMESDAWIYTYTYPYGNTEYRGHEHLHPGTQAWQVTPPKGAPAVTPRVIVLVDPYRPKRCTLVPSHLFS